VELRPLRTADARPILQLRLANREHLAWTEPDRDDPDARYTLEGIEGWITQHTRAFVILDGAEISGTISIFNVSGRPALSGMIGYWVDERRTGRGLATAAVAAILEVAWHDLGLHRVEAGTRADNRASQRVLEKNGFTQVGLLRRHLLIGGEWVDHLLWEKLEDD
jgi:[ribosomal protein S5]-alanine N-acetyltransferase